MLTVGEVHTGLIQHATALSGDQCTEVLSCREGEAVLRSERPTAYAVSPDVLTGVDCLLPSASGRRVRAAGTVSARTVITGGRIVQGSARARIRRGEAGRRLPWSHYLATPGEVETIGKADWSDVGRGFLATGATVPDRLDVTAISVRALESVQQAQMLDRRPPLRTPRTSLRWVIRTDNDRDRAEGVFTVATPTVRTLELTVGRSEVPDAIALCEDLGLHDWLLTTLGSLLEWSLTSPRPASDKVVRLRPVIEHLLHLWMPGARVADGLRPVWSDIEHRPGFSRQWDASVSWIRDQVTVGTMALMQAMTPTLPVRVPVSRS